MLEQTVRLERRLGRKRWRRGGRKGAPRVRKPPGRKRKLERSVQREPTVLQLPLQRRRGRSVQVGLILGSEQLWRLFFLGTTKGFRQSPSILSLDRASCNSCSHLRDSPAA